MLLNEHLFVTRVSEVFGRVVCVGLQKRYNARHGNKTLQLSSHSTAGPVGDWGCAGAKLTRVTGNDRDTCTNGGLGPENP